MNFKIKFSHRKWCFKDDRESSKATKLLHKITPSRVILCSPFIFHTQNCLPGTKNNKSHLSNHSRAQKLEGQQTPCVWSEWTGTRNYKKISVRKVFSSAFPGAFAARIGWYSQCTALTRLGKGVEFIIRNLSAAIWRKVQHFHPHPQFLHLDSRPVHFSGWLHGFMFLFCCRRCNTHRLHYSHTKPATLAQMAPSGRSFLILKPILKRWKKSSKSRFCRGIYWWN